MKQIQTSKISSFNLCIFALVSVILFSNFSDKKQGVQLQNQVQILTDSVPEKPNYRAIYPDEMTQNLYDISPNIRNTQPITTTLEREKFTQKTKMVAVKDSIKTSRINKKKTLPKSKQK